MLNICQTLQLFRKLHVYWKLSEARLLSGFSLEVVYREPTPSLSKTFFSGDAIRVQSSIVNVSKDFVVWARSGEGQPEMCHYNGSQQLARSTNPHSKPTLNQLPQHVTFIWGGPAGVSGSPTLGQETYHYNGEPTNQLPNSKSTSNQLTPNHCNHLWMMAYHSTNALIHCIRVALPNIP